MRSNAVEAFQTTALILGSAVLFAGFFLLNEWLFSKIAYSEGVNWIFLPAGFRVILILVLGLQGALGIMLGSLLISQDLFQEGLGHLALLNAMVSGFTPWMVMKVLENRHQLNRHLQQLSSQQLLNFTLIYAALNALAHQAIWLMIGLRDVNIWVDIWPMFIGDVLGALIMLYGMKWVIGRLPIAPRSDA